MPEKDEIRPLEAKWMPDLTPVQRGFVLAGAIHGDFQMETLLTLRDKGLFYVDIDSPNGQYGTMRLTTYGKRVQAALRLASEHAEGD